MVAVTSLADAGPGSLRAALEDASGPRTVVFRTSGTIVLSRHIRMEGEADSFVTVAGQTAPGDGVQLAPSASRFAPAPTTSCSAI